MTTQSDSIIAVLAADIHLSSRPPIARCDDWQTVQKRYLRQLYEAAPAWDVPVIVAGDIFDTHSPPPFLINFAIDNLPECYAVAGNHELPSHRLADIEQSAFWTMVKLGKIKYLRPNIPEIIHDKKLVLHGFSFGVPLKPLPKDAPMREYSDWKQVAVIHAYCWKEGHEHPGAKKEQHVSAYRKKLRGYDAVVFGDNHRGFLSTVKGKQPILNVGMLIRRRSDEVDYVPKIGFLHASGKITRKALDISRDKFHKIEKIAKILGAENDTSFVTELNQLEDTGFDFKTALLRRMEQAKTKPSVRSAVLEILEKSG